ncbi:hypothetical protein QYE76_034765 [Lolium multiflorum]|uniref:RING-type E3 ubiquitin transferase n=1 Tax=Lolium multiflorum TaxID=4521 RepID=A0AAD8QYP6_LOLMU|nr:hypothetical protein QYE76_034765 [Lolium multiflorum]
MQAARRREAQELHRREAREVTGAKGGRPAAGARRRSSTGAWHRSSAGGKQASTYDSSRSSRGLYSHLIMLNLYPRLSASSRSLDADSGDDGVARPGAFFGIAVACVSILLFCCVLAATASALKAGAFAGTFALLLVVLGCFAPRTSWIRGHPTGRPASAVLTLTVRSSGGCAYTPADAPPAFAFVCPLEKCDSRGIGGDDEEAVSSCVVVCPVCLEGVHGGEMVRQLPACKHVFHVECIDMWLHSHGTCPMCRCVISQPPPTEAAKAFEPEEEPASSSDEALPPVWLF